MNLKGTEQEIKWGKEVYAYLEKKVSHLIKRKEGITIDGHYYISYEELVELYKLINNIKDAREMIYIRDMHFAKMYHVLKG